MPSAKVERCHAWTFRMDSSVAALAAGCGDGHKEAEPAPTETTVHGLLRASPETANMLASLLGAKGEWTQVAARASGPQDGGPVQAILAAHPETAVAAGTEPDADFV